MQLIKVSDFYLVDNKTGKKKKSHRFALKDGVIPRDQALCNLPEDHSNLSERFSWKVLLTFYFDSLIVWMAIKIGVMSPEI